MKKTAIVILMVLMTVTSSWALGLPKLVGGGDDSGPTIEDAMGIQNDLVSAYVDGNKYDLEAKSIIADALGLKEQAATLKMASESINEGNVKDIDANRVKTEDAQKAIDKKMTESEALSDESKAKIGESLVCLTKCVVSYKKAADLSQGALESAQAVVKNAPITQMVTIKKKLDPVLTIAPKVPSDLPSVVETTSRYVQFARSAGVEPPSDLEAALGDI